MVAKTKATLLIIDDTAETLYVLSDLLRQQYLVCTRALLQRILTIKEHW